MLKRRDDWPWQPAPRVPAPELSGDLGGAVAFGLAVSREELEDVTALICSGIPAEVACKAAWKPESVGRFVVEVDTPDVKFRQTFIRTDHSLAVDQDAFYLPDDEQQRGHAKRLMRNLVVLYDRLGVRHASVVANHTIGGYSWAKLGAQPIDPDLQRKTLLGKLESVAQALQLTADELRGARDALASAAPHELMYRAASLARADRTSIGKALLVGAYWEGFWDLEDPWLRKLLRETIR